MSTSAPTPDPGLPVGPVQDGSASAHADGRAKLHVKDETRWAEAVKPLPAVLNRLEKHALTVTILLFAFLAMKAIVMAKDDIPAALGHPSDHQPGRNRHRCSPVSAAARGSSGPGHYRLPGS
jgi:hypothetical protein